jgi:hypothetical protein
MSTSVPLDPLWRAASFAGFQCPWCNTVPGDHLNGVDSHPLPLRVALALPQPVASLIVMEGLATLRPVTPSQDTGRTGPTERAVILDHIVLAQVLIHGFSVSPEMINSLRRVSDLGDWLPPHPSPHNSPIPAILASTLRVRWETILPCGVESLCLTGGRTT